VFSVTNDNKVFSQVLVTVVSYAVHHALHDVCILVNTYADMSSVSSQFIRVMYFIAITAIVVTLNISNK